jgi:hypothetical protein
MSSIYLAHVRDKHKRRVGSSGGFTRAVFEHAIRIGWVDGVWMAKAPRNAVYITKQNVDEIWACGFASVYKKVHYTSSANDGVFLLPCQINNDTKYKLCISPLCGGVLQDSPIDDSIVSYKHGDMWPKFNLITKSGKQPTAYQKSKTLQQCQQCKLVTPLKQPHMMVADPWQLLNPKRMQNGWTLVKLFDDNLQSLLTSADVELINLKESVWTLHIDAFKKGHNR